MTGSEYVRQKITAILGAAQTYYTSLLPTHHTIDTG